MEDICEFLSLLVNVHGKTTLKEFLKRTLLKKNKELSTFLEDEIHDLYHIYEEEDCCRCAGIRKKKGKTYIREEQWTRMYEIQRGKCKHCKKQKKTKTICQYGVIADVTISAFDITLLTTLLLHFQKRFNFLDYDIKHILCISKNRDWMAHDEHSTSTVPIVRDRCNDITVSINELAGACSSEFAKERDMKIKLEKETYWNLFELQEKFPEHSVSLVKKENRQQICIGTDIRKRHSDHEQLQEYFNKLRYDENPTTRINGIHLSREDDVSYDIDQIRTRFSVDEYKGRVLRDIDPSSVIGCLHRCGHLTDSETQALTEITDTVECSKSFLQTILSKDDQVIENFMESLLETEQRSTHDYILGHDHLGKLMLEVTSDIPLEHPASFDTVMKIELKNRPDLQKMILNHLDSEEKIGNMRVSDKEPGSVLIRLKPDTPDACEKFTKAYYNGTLRQHIEDYLKRAGVLEKLIEDQVKVVVTISMAGSANAKLDRTIYDKHWDYLIEQLSPKPVVDLLRQKGILDDNDVKDIFRTQTRFSQSNTLLCKLNVKGSETVQEFKNALTETSKDYILRKIQESEEIPSVKLVLTDNSLDASGHATNTTDDLIPMEKSLTDYFQDASYHAPKTEEMLITNESVNEQKLRILLLDGGRRALRYTILRIVLDVNLKNMDEQTKLQLCENDRNMLFPSDISLPSLKGLTDAGLHTVWTQVLQQNPGTPGTTQEIIHDYLVNKGLTTQLENNKPRIQTMMEQKLLSQDQWKMLFPQSNATFRFENIDFELLCFLIHHVFQLQPSSCFQLIGPVPSVVCIGDDLSRLKYHRDILAQKSSAGIDNKEFNTAWTEIRDIFLRLVGQCFSDEIQYLYDCPADPAKAVEFKNLREEMKKRLANVQDPDGLHNLEHGKDSFLDKALSTEMSKEPENITYTTKGKDSSLDKVLSTEMSKEPENIIYATKEPVSTHSYLMDVNPCTHKYEDRPHFMLNTLAAWRKEDIHITKGVEAVKEKISSHCCVCVIGVPGAGKSYALHHAALYLQTEGFIIYCVYGPDEFLKYYDINKKQVFVLDGALGVYSVDQSSVKLWQEHNENVRLALGTNTKMLVSIRTQIFRSDTLLDERIVFLEKSMTTEFVDLSDASYKLELDDMRHMLAHFMRKKGIDPDNIDKVIRHVWGDCEKQWTEMTEEDSQNKMTQDIAGLEFADCFPLLCSVFVNTDLVKSDPKSFFRNPFRALTKVFQNIKTDNKFQFCALVLCTMFDGNLTDDLVNPLSESALCDDRNKLDEDEEIRNYIMSVYQLKCPDDLERLQSALNCLSGVYITRTDDRYKLSHPVYHDIVTYLYNDPLFVFKFGTCEFIRDRVRLNKDEHQHDPYILVYSEYTNIERLADRLFRDLKCNAVTGAKFIACNSNIDDDRLVSFLRSRLCDREQTDKTMIDNLFRECMKCLLDEGCSYQKCYVSQYKIIQVCLHAGVDCNMDIAGLYPLHISVKTGSRLLTQLLLHHGADRRRVVKGDVTVLHIVCRESRFNKLYLIKLVTQVGDLSVVRFITNNRHEILQELSDVSPDDSDGSDDSDGDRKLQIFGHSNLQLEKVLSDNSIEVLTTDKRNLQLEKVLSDNSIEVLTTDKRRMKHYLKHLKQELQLVERVSDNILTYADLEGRNVLHYLADDIDSTSYMIGLMSHSDTSQAVNQHDKDGLTPYWFVINKKHPDMGQINIYDKYRQDMIQLYKNNHANLHESCEEGSLALQ